MHPMRDVVLTAVGVSAEDYYVNGSVPTYNQVFEELDGKVNDALALYDTEMNGVNEDTGKEQLKNGPKNELYLGPNETLLFKTKTNRVIGTATLTKVQTSSSTKATFSTGDIIAAAPAGCVPISLAGTSVKFGGTGKLNVTCL